MCTTKTLEKHIKNYAELSAQIAELEKQKRIESTWIIEELQNRNEDRHGGYKITTRTEEKPDKNELMANYPAVWEAVKRVVTSKPFLAKCKEA